MLFDYLKDQMEQRAFMRDQLTEAQFIREKIIMYEDLETHPSNTHTLL